MKNSYSKMVKAHEKSIVLGGGMNLFPVDPGKTKEFADIVKKAIERAEIRAYQQGLEDAQAEMRKAMGISK